MFELTEQQKKDLILILQCQINQKEGINPVFVGDVVTIQQIKSILAKIKLHT